MRPPRSTAGSSRRSSCSAWAGGRFAEARGGAATGSTAPSRGGCGARAGRGGAVGGDYRIDVSKLRGMLDADVAEGLRPICVVGNAGTINTGATDDLRSLAALCRERRLWFHVDGAFGALAYLSPKLRPIVEGLEQ